MAKRAAAFSKAQKRPLRLGRVVAFVQSCMIFLLLVAVSEEYSHNQYLQAWISQHMGGLGFLLNGTLAAFYAGVVIVYYFAGPSKETAVPLLKKEQEIILIAEAS